MKLYLEISSLGSACGHMSFECIEKTLLHCWARSSPQECKKFLIENGYITFTDQEDLLKDHTLIFNESISKVSPEDIQVSNFKEIVDNSVGDLKKLRNFQGSSLDEKEEKEFITTAQSKIKQVYGTNAEKKVVSVIEASVGNDKMFYYHLNKNWCFGGKHDAIKDDIIIEIKSRTSYSNVKKNKYDLYQLYGYLLAMKKDNGKIIQKFENKIFDSDVENNKEWGLIKKQEHNEQIHTMLKELYYFFERLELIIKNKRMELNDIKLAIPDKYIPICNIDSNNKLINHNFSYKKIINFM